ncbi:MAG TPA: hypothetical protein VIB08_03605 [Thermoanaerobaculia bacterium]
MPRLAARVLPSVLALAGALVASAAHAQWLRIGPNDVGMVTALAGGGTAVYAATCNGVYRSDDGAASWHEAGLQRRNVVRLAVDGAGGADTLYAIVDNRVFVGPVPEPSHLALPNLFLGSSLWVSRDGGETWSNRELSSGHAVAVDPTQPGTAYVGCYNGIYGPLAVTHDHGTTWRAMPDAPHASIYTDFAVDSRDGALYAAAGRLYTFSGGSWSSHPAEVTVVAAGSGADGAVYAAGFGTFCRKTSAADWSCNAFPENTALDLLEVPPQSQGESPRILLLTFSGILSSDDGGATFSPLAASPKGFAPAAALDPDGASVYVGSDIGVYRSSDRGMTWTKSSRGLSSTWVRALAIDPGHPSRIWAGAEGRIQDLYQEGPGLFRSTDGGASWAPTSSSDAPGYVFSLGIDPSNPNTVFTGSFGRGDRSTDGGATWTQTGPSFHLFVHALVVEPGSSSTVWAAHQILQKSVDGGQTWSNALLDSIFSLLFDSRHPGTIYAGESWEEPGFYYPYGSGWAVRTSRDGGATWTRAGSPEEGAVTALAIDPFSDDVVYAGTYAGTILRSPDAGASWERWNTQDIGYAVFALAADPARPGRLYIGGWGGLYRSENGGRTWEIFSEGLAPYGVFGLAITPDGQWLYAGTTGGGVFRRSLLSVERAPPEPASGARTTREVIRE